MEDWYVYGGVARGGQPRLWQHRFRQFYPNFVFPEPLLTEAGENIITENGEELEADLT